MSKVTLEFNLPEEEEEYRITTDALAMHSAILDFLEYIRSKRKYAEEHEKSFEDLADYAWDGFGKFSE